MAEVRNIVMGGARVYTADSVDTVNTADATKGFIGNATAHWTDYIAAGSYQAKSVTDDDPAGNQTVGFFSDYNNVAEIGYTSEGIDLSFEPEYTDVEVDQLLDSAIIFKTSQRVSFGTTVTEATLANLARVLGQNQSTVDNTSGFNAAGEERVLTIEGGSLGSFPEETSLLAVANGPRVDGFTSERIFEAYRAISVESIGVPVKRNETTQYPVTFRCLPEGGGNYMKIADRIY